MLSDSEINAIVSAEENDALDFDGEISDKRQYLLDRYNGRPFDKVPEGNSQAMTSEVADTVESMLPSLLRQFTQSKDPAIFTAETAEGDDEADQKTKYCSWVFYRDNQGVRILHDMFKDALLQYFGVVKVCWDESKNQQVERYRGLSELELAQLKTDEELEIDSIEQDEAGFYNVEATRSNTLGRIKLVNIPPEEMKIDRNARDWENPRFIGHRTPKTRSELIDMGFDADIVNSLPADVGYFDANMEKQARYYDYSGFGENNPAAHHPNDVVYLGEYYAKIDVDEDGIAELWQVFRAGNQVLAKERTDVHPFAAVVPVPMPHRAIGSCPAEQVADIQIINSTLLRQALNNVYANNYNRIAANERVDLDDLLTPRPGGVIRVEGMGPIGDSVLPLPTQNISAEILGMMEYVQTMKEARTGVTRYNQGLDTDALNKTATGFKGIMDASLQRLDLIARLFAETGVKQLFEKIIMWASKYQNESRQIRVLGRPMEIDPTGWRHNTDCAVNVGLGAGDRQEKLFNLNAILQIQRELMGLGSPLTDGAKVYNTLERLITEVGLKDASLYFNDPAKPEEVLQAENEQLYAAVQQLQAQLQNPLAQQEQIRQEGSIARDQMKIEADMQKFLIQMEQQQKEFRQEMIAKLTELELKYSANVPGSAV